MASSFFIANPIADETIMWQVDMAGVQVRTINFGASSSNLAFDGAQHMYVCSGNGTGIKRINASTGAYVDTIPGTDVYGNSTCTWDTVNHMYVTNGTTGNGNTKTINISTHTVDRVVTDNWTDKSFVVANGWVYACNAYYPTGYGANKLIRYSIATGLHDNTVYTTVSDTSRACYDGTYLYVTGATSTDLGRLVESTGSASTLYLGLSGAGGIAYDSINHRVYVLSNFSSSTPGNRSIKVIDCATFTVAQTIVIPSVGGLNDICWDKANHMFVTAGSIGVLKLFRINTDTYAIDSTTTLTGTTTGYAGAIALSEYIDPPLPAVSNSNTCWFSAN